MLLWIIFAAMTGAAIFALLWPLGHGRTLAFADGADAKSLYRSQVAEIDRDLGRGLIGSSEAEAARVEAARRLLRAADGEVGPAGETESSLRRRRASSALALSCVPLLALLVYGAYGSPTKPDLPLSARLNQDPTRQDFAVSLARIETHLAENPTDGRGWSVLAPVYLRQGRAEEAARAFAAAIANGQDGAEMHAGLGEARIMAAGGVVTAQARESLADALGRDPANARARFFLALAREQDGDRPGAVAAFEAMLKDAPPGAPWVAVVRQRLEALGAESARSAVADLPDAERSAAIRGMVDGLAQRLAAGGGTPDEWERLIRSQSVLGDRAAALRSVATAKERLVSDPAAVARIATLAAELRLTEGTP